MNLKYIFLFLLCFCGVQSWLTAQATSDHIWINEFHYDEMTTRSNPDANEFIELIVHNDILDNPTEVAKFELVLVSSGGLGLDEASTTPRGLPYHISSRIYSESASVHPIANNDPVGLDDNFQKCAVIGQNYSVLSKTLPNLQDVTAGFAIIYDNKDVVQFLSYEGSFKGCECPESGALAGETSELIDVEEENTLTDPNHSIQLLGTGSTYSEFTWDGLPVINTASACSVNAGQTVNDLPCIAPSITNPGALSACGATFTLPEIEGSFLTGTQAYYNDSQENNGTIITQVTSDMTVYIYDSNGECSDEEFFDVTFAAGITIQEISNPIGCDEYILPAIQGEALTGSEAYFTEQNGMGTKYLAGDPISTSQRLYMYDSNGLCSAEQAVDIDIRVTQTIDALASQEVCDNFEFPAINGTGLSGMEAYYTEPLGMGEKFDVGATSDVSRAYYIYDVGAACPQELLPFSVLVTPTPIIDSPMGTLEGCNELILPEIEGSNLSNMRTYYTAADGDGDEVLIGTRLTESVMLHAYDEVNGCKASQPFMVNINAFVPGFAGESQTITEGDDVAPFNVVEAATGNGTFEFQWQSSTNNFTYTDIANATMETYDEGVLTETTFYRRNTTMTTASNVVCEDDGKRLVVNVEEANDALSVELLSFTATAQERKTLLNWATANEANADGFFVEWSTDGVSFTDLGFVKARNAAGSYEYLHENPASNRNYYRLRQVDLNSKSAHSSIVSVNFAVDFNATLAFFPNPSDGKVGIDLDATYDLTKKIVVEVFDAKGQLVLTSNLLNSNRLDLSSLASGVYQVRLSQNDEQQLGQVIIK